MCGKQQGEGARRGPVMRNSCPPSNFRNRSRSESISGTGTGSCERVFRRERPIRRHRRVISISRQRSARRNLPRSSVTRIFHTRRALASDSQHRHGVTIQSGNLAPHPRYPPRRLRSRRADRRKGTRASTRLPPRRLGPERALVRRRYPANALEHELLQALALPGFGRIDVAFRVHGDAVHAVELARLAPTVAERR